MEIERKFLVKALPEHLESFSRHRIEQAYLCTDPVLRIRRKDETYILTYKGPGFLVREEHEFPLKEESYEQLLKKAEGNVISKWRYRIPYEAYVIELDVFDPPFAPLILAEVEFSTEEEATLFEPPVWFGEDVTYNPSYTNAAISQRSFETEKA
jgi:CYTH domain-containing protein